MQKALAPEISTWPDAEPRLIGSRCTDCAATTFPAQARCPKCSGGNTEQVRLPRRGTVIAWTTQGFPPGAPYKGPTGKTSSPSASVWSNSPMTPARSSASKAASPKTTRRNCNSAWTSNSP